MPDPAIEFFQHVLNFGESEVRPPDLPRVLRTHLHAYLCRIYAAAFCANTGLCIYLPAHPARRLYPLAVRQSSALPTSSFGFHLSVDTLAVQLTLPLAECVEATN